VFKTTEHERILALGSQCIKVLKFAMMLFFPYLYHIVICIIGSDINSYEQSAVVEINVNDIIVLQQIEKCATESVFIF
jgi:hypothetical protein